MVHQSNDTILTGRFSRVNKRLTPAAETPGLHQERAMKHGRKNARPYARDIFVHGVGETTLSNMFSSRVIMRFKRCLHMRRQHRGNVNEN